MLSGPANLCACPVPPQRALLEQKQKKKRQEPLMVQANADGRPRSRRARQSEEQAPLVESYLSSSGSTSYQGRACLGVGLGSSLCCDCPSPAPPPHCFQSWGCPRASSQTTPSSIPGRGSRDLQPRAPARAPASPGFGGLGGCSLSTDCAPGQGQACLQPLWTEWVPALSEDSFFSLLSLGKSHTLFGPIFSPRNIEERVWGL